MHNFFLNPFKLERKKNVTDIFLGKLEKLCFKGPFSEYLKEHMNDEQTTEPIIEKIEAQNKEANQDLSKDKVTGDIVKEPKINIDKSQQKQYEKETMETGRVDFSVYTFYIKSMGLHFFGSSIIFMIIYQAQYIY